MYVEDDLIPISALQHVLFCERQFALIHIEQIWQENRFTAEGQLLHERVDMERHESRRLFRQEFGMAVRSLAWGLTGRCDLVEVRFSPDQSPVEVMPVEFKRGTKKVDDIDRVQLCAQAICLEEMFDLPVPRGQLYYHKDHRRVVVDMDETLREKTNAAADRIRKLFADGRTPAAVYEKRKCDRCSLFDWCMPKNAGAGRKRVDRYVLAQVHISGTEAQ